MEWCFQSTFSSILIGTCEVVLEHPSTSVVMNTCSETSYIITEASVYLVFSLAAALKVEVLGMLHSSL